MPRDGGSVPAKRKRGNQPTYSQAVADLICDRIAAGESLRAICRDPGMPDEATVRTWVRDDRGADEEIGRAGFATHYSRARDLGFESIAEEVIEISDEDHVGPDGYVDNGAIQMARHRTESRKWFLSKMMPSRFGDKVTQEIVGDADQPLITRIELVPVDPRPRAIEPPTIDAKPKPKR